VARTVTTAAGVVWILTLTLPVVRVSEQASKTFQISFLDSNIVFAVADNTVELMTTGRIEKFLIKTFGVSPTMI
jgi:hypothetical protein